MIRLAIILASLPLIAQNVETVLGVASAAIQRGDFQAAETQLRKEIDAHPGDARAFSLLGVALDGQQKVGDARDAHRRAVELLPDSAETLNNFGAHLWRSASYAEAEGVFSKALQASPTSFNILYNLGVMAALAGHNPRAVEVLKAALAQQPANVDVLYRLGIAEEASGQIEQATQHFAMASRLAPQRAEIRRMLALTAMELGALSDASEEWGRYLALKPDDEEARREAGFTLAKMGEIEKGAAAIQAYVKQHPEDPVGHFELGQAEKNRDPLAANQHFSRAIELRPDYSSALIARGSLAYQLGKPESALPDLERGIALSPPDAQSLDRLGQVYVALNRTDDGVRAFRRAAALAPSDSKIALHLGRALADAGDTAESKTALDRFRAAGPEQKAIVPAGMISYLGMTAEQRLADYKKRVDKGVLANPDDPSARLEQLKLAAETGNRGMALAAGRKLLGSPLVPQQTLADAGRTLMQLKQYDLARQLLGKSTDTKFELTRLGILTLGRPNLLPAIEQALRDFPDRPDLYLDAVPALVRAGEAAEAVRLLEKAAQPDRDLQLLYAIALNRAGRSKECAAKIAELQGRWPEWPGVWAVDGLIQLSGRNAVAARQSLEAGVALGANGPSALNGLSLAYGMLSLKVKAEGIKKRRADIYDSPSYLDLAFKDPGIKDPVIK